MPKQKNSQKGFLGFGSPLSRSDGAVFWKSVLGFSPIFEILVCSEGEWTKCFGRVDEEGSIRQEDCKGAGAESEGLKAGPRARSLCRRKLRRAKQELKKRRGSGSFCRRMGRGTGGVVFSP